MAHRGAGGVAVVDLEGLAGGGGRAGVDRVQRRRGEQRHPAQDIDFLGNAAQKKSPARASVGRARSHEAVEVVRSWVSWPRVGKHIVFDGRLLHGAPAELARPKRAPKRPSRKRSKRKEGGRKGGKGGGKGQGK